MMKKVTKVAMCEFLREMLATDARWAKAALVRIYDNQTMDEQQTKDTHVWNAIGFRTCDARILTSFAEFYKARGFLSNKQMTLLFRKMPAYAGQLMKMPYFNEEKLEAAYVKAMAV